jgi:hypothetical protein
MCGQGDSPPYDEPKLSQYKLVLDTLNDGAALSQDPVVKSLTFSLTFWADNEDEANAFAAKAMADDGEPNSLGQWHVEPV